MHSALETKPPFFTSVCTTNREDQPVTKDDVRTFRDKLDMTREDFARFLGLEARDASRVVYSWERGERGVPDAVAQLIRVAEAVPAARLLMAGELRKRATLASVANKL
jgi:DNA-binding transcriptional regulator YiaG